MRTLFRMPDLFSLGLGGGSIVQDATPPHAGGVGPDSVGYRLTEEALVFGGETSPSPTSRSPPASVDRRPGKRSPVPRARSAVLSRRAMIEEASTA